MSLIDQQSLDLIFKSNKSYIENIPGFSLALIDNNYEISSYTSGYARSKTNEMMTKDHYLQCASLSKTVAAAFSIGYFKTKNIDMNTSVNKLLSIYNATWSIQSNSSAYNGDDVTLTMLINHTALGMHYVYGMPLSSSSSVLDSPPIRPLQLLNGTYSSIGYKNLVLQRKPGALFSYSGGGFVVLQYLLETMENKSIDEITRPFLDNCGLKSFIFTQPIQSELSIAYGHKSHTEEVPPLVFPPLAAGALCKPTALAEFLCHLSKAYHNLEGSGSISHFTARSMLSEEATIDMGALDFMGAKIGLGVFVARAGENRIMLHQAANDGFRGVYMLCFEGPDQGKGFVFLSNGDNPAVLFQCEVARLLLKGLNISGINYEYFQQVPASFDMKSVKQEAIVNKGLKGLVMDAFLNSKCNHQAVASLHKTSKL